MKSNESNSRIPSGSHTPYRQRVFVADLELSKPVPSFENLEGYVFLQLLARWKGQPVTYLKVPVRGGRCDAAEITALLCEKEHGLKLAKELVRLGIENNLDAENWTIPKLLQLEARPATAALPTISVVVCTRDRTEDLVLCLESFRKLVHRPMEILVIDNAPQTDATRQLVEESYPEARYIKEPRPGLDWARNRAIGEARGEILAYTDDDVIVDPLWTQALVRLFGENPAVMCATGLVAPHEIESEAQAHFERYGGFGRGFDRIWYRTGPRERHNMARLHGGAGKFGTGANMAFRREVFAEIGWFDPALDVGTVTNGGGDLDMYFRVLKHGFTLVYEPAAVVWHRHRRDMAKLRSQIANNGIGLISYFVRNTLAYPEEKVGFLRLSVWWLRHWALKRWVSSLLKPPPVPKELAWGELKGGFIGLTRYQKAKRIAAEIVKTHGEPVYGNAPQNGPKRCPDPSNHGIAVRAIDIAGSLEGMNDVTSYPRVKTLITRGDESIGEVTFENFGHAIGADEIADTVSRWWKVYLLKPTGPATWAEIEDEVMSALKSHFGVSSGAIGEQLPASVPVSIVLATRDRPAALQECLASLSQQEFIRPVEIIVVDNNPASGLTPPVTAPYPEVKLVQEHRAGLSYARNTGIVAATGDILICVDDDVTFPPDWLESLVGPFSRNDVYMVMGNVLPAQLENACEIQFENYGGLGKGFIRKIYNRRWMESFRRWAVPTWNLGATANAAVRAEAMRDPAIGLLDEALGTGGPAGAGEDTLLFYRVLNAGHTIIYEPKSYVWHKHRATDKALNKQIWNYSKGHACYNLTTWLEDGDARGLARVFFEIPRYHFRQLIRWALRSRRRTLRTLLLEIFGNAYGVIALWQSRRRVRRLGKVEFGPTKQELLHDGDSLEIAFATSKNAVTHASK